jgi:hypothetical protein|nr:MAG TPA: hypothetical protein [Caudoviricetes sp.]
MTGAFVMTDEEIRRSYLRAKGRSTQVRILAELNAVNVSAMQKKLIELGLMEKPKPVRRPTPAPTPAPAAKPTAEPVAPTELREGERRNVTAENACNVRDLYDLLGRFIRLGWGAAALTVGGKRVQVPSVCMSCDFQNNLCLDLEGRPR